MESKFIRNTKYLIREDGTIISPFGRTISPWKEANTGYLLIRIRKDKKPLCLRVHRILAEAFIENPEEKPFVRHLNDIKDDNRLENLEWGDNPTNTQEGYDNSCYKFPDKRSYGVKATCHETGEIFTFKSIRFCAEGLGVNRKNLSAILKGNKENNYPYDFEYFEMSND